MRNSVDLLSTRGWNKRILMSLRILDLNNMLSRGVRVSTFILQNKNGGSVSLACVF